METNPYQVKMDPQAHKQLKKLASQLGITIGEMIQNLLASFKFRLKRIAEKHGAMIDSELHTEIIRLLLKMDAGKATELCLHYVQACPGNAVCKYGIQDSLGLGIEIEEFFSGMELPAKVKIGISGCPFCCGESFVRDIGILGKKKGWKVIFGGNSGRRPRIGDIIAEDIEREEVLKLTKRCLEYYAANGKKKERTARFIERIGIDEFKKSIL